MSEELLSTLEAAAYLGISRQAMHALAKRNEIGRRIGRSFAFTRAELDEWLAKPRPQGGRPPKRAGQQPEPPKTHTLERE